MKSNLNGKNRIRDKSPRTEKLQEKEVKMKPVFLMKMKKKVMEKSAHLKSLAEEETMMMMIMLMKKKKEEQ